MSKTVHAQGAAPTRRSARVARLAAAGLLTFALCGGRPVAAQTLDAAPVIAAERAFAADAAELGITASFNAWAAPGGLVIGPAGVQAVEVAYPPSVPKPVDEPRLAWWPNYAGMARSGDLGFTTGAVEVDGVRGGHYFTIWKRQPDGAWKWVYDGGNGASSADAAGPDAEPTLLPVGQTGSGSAGAALVEVAKLERRLAEQARLDQRSAHLEMLSEDARLHVSGVAPATRPAARREALGRWPALMEFGAAEGGSASEAGDLVWTHGPARWERDGAERHGHYVRIWQLRPEGWRLVFAQLVAEAPRSA